MHDSGSCPASATRRRHDSPSLTPSSSARVDLGSAVVPILVAAGVGTITSSTTIWSTRPTCTGRSCTAPPTSAARRSTRLPTPCGRSPPTPRVIAHRGRFTRATAAELLSGADILIDGSDTNETRFAANDAAVAAGIPLVWGSALRWSGQVGIAWGGTDYRDLFPDGPDAEADTCEIAGILPSVCTVIGGLMATESLKLLTGIGEPLIGRVVLFDALTGTSREVRYARDPARTASAAPAAASAGRHPIGRSRHASSPHC